MNSNSVVSEYNEKSVAHLESRVRSFKADALHSNSYLKPLSRFLRQAVSNERTSGSKSRIPQASYQPTSFLHTYRLDSESQGKPTTYQKSEDLFATPEGSRRDAGPELLIMTGYPSPDWLNAIHVRYGVDHRFFHRHLDFVPSGQRDRFDSFRVPSRSQDYLRLWIPSIVFVGPEGRSLTLEELRQARESATAQLKQKYRNFFANVTSSLGRSIVRNVNIHTGSAIVLEQVVSITVIGSNANRKVLIWIDSADDADIGFLPVPQTERFKGMGQGRDFCPVFFGGPEHATSLFDQEPPLPRDFASHQPLSALARRYGETLDWTQLSKDSLLVLEEIFHFQSAATMQYLEMIEKQISRLLDRSDPVERGVHRMEDMIHFEYTKTVLVRWTAHLRSLVSALDDTSHIQIFSREHVKEETRAMMKRLQHDLRFLMETSESLIQLCESGKSTIMSSFTVSESRKTFAESQLVTKLTKTTNRLTFIFLPISFVTSVFGMNFRQLGSGTLTIWLWLEITAPLLILCILIVEWGTLFNTFCRKQWSKISNKR